MSATLKNDNFFPHFDQFFSLKFEHNWSNFEAKRDQHQKPVVFSKKSSEKFTKVNIHQT